MGNSDPNHWSGTHIRLRAELFLTGLAIFGVKYLDLHLHESGLVPVKLGTDPHPIWVYIALYGLFLYFAGALWLRTVSESYLRKGIPSKSLEAVERFERATSGPQPAPVVHRVDDPTISMRDYSSFSQANKARALVERLVEAVPEAQRDSVTSYVAELNQLLAEAGKTLEQREAFQARLRTIEAVLPEIREQIKISENRTKQNYEEYVAAITELGSSLVRKISLWRTMTDWEHYLFGLWVPVVAATFLAASPLISLVFPSISFAAVPSDRP